MDVFGQPSICPVTHLPISFEIHSILQVQLVLVSETGNIRASMSVGVDGMQVSLGRRRCIGPTAPCTAKRSAARTWSWLQRCASPLPPSPLHHRTG